MADSADPKTVQDLTEVVQNLLQQMQDKFQTMSDQIIGRNILSWTQGVYCGDLVSLYKCDLCTSPLYVLSLIQTLDEMSTRIDDLEKNIADLMTQAGVDEEDPGNKQAPK
ncbi:hypothetical protein AB205_0019410 [Aquarana catesbeiana]|uniref:Heat shock factor-binding protein 1 n=1 Tax=Aquarana catesbeiana TaxID=8400 RepID=A0A2G9SJP3_AQUCT|nr:hypothetical protein AB205_0019410 [Aquarana catesbeiana]